MFFAVAVAVVVAVAVAVTVTVAVAVAVAVVSSIAGDSFGVPVSGMRQRENALQRMRNKEKHLTPF